jgi:membrane peptidoglycan carboxypeptidase
VKNTETGNQTTFARKFQEAQDAIRLERTYTKDKILELYLNQVYLGHGTYGIASAAEYYFNKQPVDLSLAQSALLAGMIQAPETWDPVGNKDATMGRRNQVLQRMLTLGWISQSEYDAAASTSIKLSKKGRVAADQEPYFVRYVKDQILHPDKGSPLVKLFGSTYEERRQALFQGGLKIYTTMKPDLQAAAAEAVQSHLPNQGPEPPADPEAAVVSIDPKTGAIRAMYGGTDFSSSQFNLATQAHRTAGSSFKAFTLAAAFEQGIPVGKVYDATPPIEIPFDDCPDAAGPWSPANAEPSEGGQMNLYQATAASVNIVFAQLIADVGPEHVADVARRMMGVPEKMSPEQQTRLGVANILPVCAITLGAVEVSPLAMTSGYSTLANDGVHCVPFSISKIVDANGKTIFKSKPKCEQVIDPGIAAQVTDMLRGVISHGTGTAANLDGRPVAGKTGTGQNYQDAWFLGYVPQVVTGVWVGYSKEEIPMRELPVLGYRNAFGGSIAAPIWHDYMLTAIAGLPFEDFPKPPPEKNGTVPDVVGMVQDDAKKTLVDANFTAIAQETDSSEPAGTVVSQSPGGGSVVPLGSAVTIMVSNGKTPKATVPNVIGSPVDQAVATLKAAGFKVTVSYQTVNQQNQDGNVLNQSPPGGTERDEGTTVTIVVGKLEQPSPKPTHPKP